MATLADLIGIFEKLAAPLGILIAVAIILAVPGFRKVIFKSYKAGQSIGHDVGQHAAGEADHNAVAQPATRGSGATVRYRACPNCGSKRHRLASTTTGWADTGFMQAFEIKDRICKECGTTYHAKLPPFLKYMLIGMGMLTGLFGLALLTTDDTLSAITCIIIGPVLLAMGLGIPKQ